MNFPEITHPVAFVFGFGIIGFCFTRVLISFLKQYPPEAFFWLLLIGWLCLGWAFV